MYVSKYPVAHLRITSIMEQTLLFSWEDSKIIKLVNHPLSQDIRLPQLLSLIFILIMYLSWSLTIKCTDVHVPLTALFWRYFTSYSWFDVFILTPYAFLIYACIQREVPAIACKLPGYKLPYDQFSLFRSY